MTLKDYGTVNLFYLICANFLQRCTRAGMIERLYPLGVRRRPLQITRKASLGRGGRLPINVAKSYVAKFCKPLWTEFGSIAISKSLIDLCFFLLGFKAEQRCMSFLSSVSSRRPNGHCASALAFSVRRCAHLWI